MLGVGVETVGTDAGAAHSFDPPFPCHSFLLGAGKYGLTQLQNLARLPPTGAVVIAGPLPIVGGSGSPARVLALVEQVNGRRARRQRAGRAGRRARVRGRGQRQLPRHERAARGRRPVRRRPARGRRGDDGRRLRADERAASRVLTVHQGCGLTNAMTGITEAAKSRTPLLVLAADTGAAAVRSNFRIDQDALVRAVGAVAERVHTPASAARRHRPRLPDGRRAAAHRRAQPARWTCRPPPAPGRRRCRRCPPLAPVRPDAGAVARAGRADRGGASARCSSPAAGARCAGRELRALGRRVRGAAGDLGRRRTACSHGDPWALGISGGFASPLAAELIPDADLVVGWGCALNMWTMRHGALIGPGARVVQVDLDADAIGANRPVDLGVLGDVAATAADVLAALAARAPATAPTRSGRRSPQRGALARRAVRRPHRPGRHRPAHAVDRARRPAARASGRSRSTPATSWATRAPTCAVPDEAGFCFTQAFQSIGLGLATAIGAALARPDRLAVAALGDGGALMAAAELETVVRLGLPMVVVVYDDRGYGAEVHHFPDADHATVTFPELDLAAVGRGYGFEAVTVRAPADLKDVADWVAGPRRAPLLVHAPIASDGGSWWLAEAFRGH